MVRIKSEFFGGEKEKPQLPKFEGMKGLGAIIGVFIFVLFWFIVSGPFFTVGPSEEGVVLRFGKYVRSVTPGFHFKWPGPIEMVRTVPVTEIMRLEVGFVTINPNPPAQYKDIPEESLMLTGDENLVNIDLAVQYQVNDAAAFLFNVYDVQGTLKDIVEAVERQVVGDFGIDSPLTSGKQEIEAEIHAKVQEIVNQYQMGVTIRNVKLQDVHPPKEVETAFKNVASARENRNKYVNEAKGYRNGEIPKAEGQAAKIVQQAEAYKARRQELAKGEVEKFSSVLKEYQKAKEVTRARIYLETMESVLPGKDKMVIDSGGEGILKILNLNEMQKGGLGQ